MLNHFKLLWKMEKNDSGFLFNPIHREKVKVLVDAETEDEAWRELYKFISN